MGAPYGAKLHISCAWASSFAWQTLPVGWDDQPLQGIHDVCRAVPPPLSPSESSRAFKAFTYHIWPP